MGSRVGSLGRRVGDESWETVGARVPSFMFVGFRAPRGERTQRFGRLGSLAFSSLYAKRHTHNKML